MDEEIWAVGDREELDASRGGKGCESFCWSPTQALGLCWHLVAGSSHCRIRTQSLENGVSWRRGGEGVLQVGQEKRVSCSPRGSHSSLSGRREAE